jgi:hypothetical protein
VAGIDTPKTKFAGCCIAHGWISPKGLSRALVFGRILNITVGCGGCVCKTAKKLRFYIPARRWPASRCNPTLLANWFWHSDTLPRRHHTHW